MLAVLLLPFARDKSGGSFMHRERISCAQRSSEPWLLSHIVYDKHTNFASAIFVFPLFALALAIVLSRIQE